MVDISKKNIKFGSFRMYFHDISFRSQALNREP